MVISPTLDPPSHSPFPLCVCKHRSGCVTAGPPCLTRRHDPALPRPGATGKQPAVNGTPGTPDRLRHSSCRSGRLPGPLARLTGPPSLPGPLARLTGPPSLPEELQGLPWYRVATHSLRLRKVVSEPAQELSICFPRGGCGVGF